MMRPLSLVWVGLGASLLLAASARGQGQRTATPKPLPVIHLTWNAPYGDARARSEIAAACSDTTRVDTLFLTFELPGRTLPLMGLSGALLFEPQSGESLGSFWYFERGGPNNGGLWADFMGMGEDADFCRTPWNKTPNGHVGYTHIGSRGRLDLSSDVPRASAMTLLPRTHYCFARVRIQQRRLDLAGCGQPMSISWEGVRFLTLTGDIRVPPAAGQRVFWNPGPGGVRRAGTKLAAAVWAPLTAPPSRGAFEPIRYPRVGRVDTTRAE